EGLHNLLRNSGKLDLISCVNIKNSNNQCFPSFLVQIGGLEHSSLKLSKPMLFFKKRCRYFLPQSPYGIQGQQAYQGQEGCLGYKWLWHSYLDFGKKFRVGVTPLLQGTIGLSQLDQDKDVLSIDRQCVNVEAFLWTDSLMIELSSACMEFHKPSLVLLAMANVESANIYSSNSDMLTDMWKLQFLDGGDYSSFSKLLLGDYFQ
ncbi:hypothetical protein Tco_1307418, partial [Tanacetum coccineum]